MSFTRNLILMVGAVTAAVPGLSKGKEIIRPNIIDILADDLGYGDLSFFGQNKIATRNIDRLAKEGMVFTKHYS